VVLLTTLGARAEAQDVVVPTQDVTTRVVVRATASALSADRGSLRPGEQAELLASVPSWYRVRLANGVEGFVSKRWTRVITASVPPAVAQVSDTIDIVDVGTGLGVLIRGPTFTVVYDAGSNDDDARGDGNRMLAFIRLVSPTLSTIDHIILSHPHKDHVELLPDLLAHYQVREVWNSGALNNICGYRAFLTAVRDEPGVKYHTATQDFGTSSQTFAAKTCYGQALPAQTLTLTHSSRIDNAPITLGPGASMTFLHADGATHSSFNENSLAVRFDLGTTRILLMGDAEAGGRKDPSVPPSSQSIEGTLLACCAADLAADVVIAGHHGSKTSSRSAFLDAVHPACRDRIRRALPIQRGDAARRGHHCRTWRSRAGLPDGQQ
jgi:beta-lactamase superfamily II metal-dependent hydrolase